MNISILSFSYLLGLTFTDETKLVALLSVFEVTRYLLYRETCASLRFGLSYERLNAIFARYWHLFLLNFIV